ncbi:MAG TPA: hypothetical protein VFE60_27780 [Roseiarcus sp.]|jgi:hypothetical protein|nr:hypothetical protein [Roseiarcus sp.]
MPIENDTPTRTTPDEVRTQIVAIAATATPEERAAVDEIIARATNAEPSSDVYKLTPPMSALIFLDHNSRNRDWRVERSLEFSRRMRERFWKYNGLSIGFYVTGVLDDGQHRLAGSALAGHTLHVPVAFGIQLGAVDTIDGGGGARHGADHAKLEGIAEAKRKQTVLVDAGRYFAKAGIASSDILLSEAEIKEAMRRNHALLTEALRIGDGSIENVVTPLLKGTQAATLAYVMVKSAWPAVNTREKLALIQLRVSHDGENSPSLPRSSLPTAARKG